MMPCVYSMSVPVCVASMRSHSSEVSNSVSQFLFDVSVLLNAAF